MIERLASWCHRRRWTVLLSWVAVAIAVTVVAGSAGDGFATAGRLAGSDSDAAYQLLRHEFPAATGDEATIVFHAPGGIAASRADIQQYVSAASAIRGVDGVTSPFTAATAAQVSHDGTTAYVPITLDPDVTGGDAVTTGILRHDADALRSNGVQVEFLGEPFSGGSAPASEMFGLLAAAFILLIAFGSVIAMGLPIITAIVGILTSLGGVTLWSHVMDTPAFTSQVASMIGIGVGIDYALFIVTRYRSERGRGLGGEAAIVEAYRTAGRAVAFAGCTVMISLLGMLLMGMSFFHGLAIGTSGAVLVSVLAALTLLPALLGIAGSKIDRFSLHSIRRGHRAPAGHESGWHRWSRLVQRQPRRFAGGGLLVLLLAGVPVLSMRLASADAGNDPAGSTTRSAYDLLAAGFGAGTNGPLLVVVETAADVNSADLDRLVATLSATPGVALATEAVASPSGRAALITVVPTTSPQDERTEALVRHLRNDVLPGSGLVAHIGGQTASNVDFATLMSSRLPIFIIAVLVLSFLLLLAVFRSVLVPLKAVVMNLLSIGAAYGVMVAVFQWGWFASLLGVHSAAPIEPWAPMMLFAIVFGLSMDYEVFLLSAVKEDYDERHDNSHAVLEGLALTARVITAAAAIMVFVFGSFLLGDERSVKLIGLGLAVAVLIDATVVRMVLVPATMELLGDRNWWIPRWLDRIVPRLQVERLPSATVVATATTSGATTGTTAGSTPRASTDAAAGAAAARELTAVQR